MGLPGLRRLDHIGSTMPDLDRAHRWLVDVLDGSAASRGPAEGNRWIYLLAPWGMQFDMVSAPAGKRWDREHPRERLDA